MKLQLAGQAVGGGVGMKRVLFAAAEIFPLAKTGGLADVAAALPRALVQLGVDVRLMMPGYPQALDSAVGKRVVAELPGGPGSPPSQIISAFTPDTRLPLLLLDCPPLYRREGGPYQDRDGRDWADNAQRFAHLCRVAADVARGAVFSDWQADVVHCNDWHTGLLPAHLSLSRGYRPPVLLTIHNLAFQGVFPCEIFDSLGLNGAMLSPEGMEFHGKVSFLKAGLVYSDALTTVSPTYAQEILTPAAGCGLDGVLRRRAADLVGILNGIDENIWSPANDCHLPELYNAANLDGKESCKAHLRQELGLENDERPLIAIVNRLTKQKMADLVAESVDQITGQGAQLALVGDGEREIESSFLGTARNHPGRVAVRIGYQEPLAHRLFAGADIVLAAARFEPCGLTPIYAMRYGSLPVVRRTGGMADAVTPANRETMREGTATGFAFDRATREDMLASVEYALKTYKDAPRWQRMQIQAMQRDSGWTSAAQQYLTLYEKLLAGRNPDLAHVAAGGL
jgi:starch synthase